MANVKEHGIVVVHPRVEEASTGDVAANGAAARDGAKNASDTTQAREPWRVEFGWDFPFDFPKPGR